ncbi:unnamed protein product [Parnassius mnemosyne]|uniref:Reverse transcriptase domain-containing protein n=1 Tax=Parnassius mnemosyne TaxID=213953 RepID=A0AAV1LFP5_9NEOP
MLKKDYENYRKEIIEKNLTTTRSQKKAYKQLSTGKKWIPTLKAQNATGEYMASAFTPSYSRNIHKYNQRQEEYKHGEVGQTRTKNYIRREVKQGDPLSQKIFIAVLQVIKKELERSRKGNKIDTELLSNLRFADDIMIFAKSSKELETIVVELNNASKKKIGLQLNALKTKVTTNSIQRPIIVNEIAIEYVDYVYLGKPFSFTKSRHEDELQRCINMTWRKY